MVTSLSCWPEREDSQQRLTDLDKPMIPRVLWWLFIVLASGLVYLLASFVFPSRQPCTGCGEGVVLTIVFASPVVAGIAIFSSVRAMRAFRLEMCVGVLVAATLIALASYFYWR
jgi:hypothetical protein